MNRRIRRVAVSLAVVLAIPALALAGGTVPQGAKITVVTDQSVSSKTAKIGETVSGSVAQDVTSEGKVVIPKGTPVKLTVSGVQASGRLSTPAKLYLRLRIVTVGGKSYTIATSSAGRTLGGKGKRDARFIGGRAGGGVVHRTLAGGGKGAGIRSGAGARRGTGGATATGGEDTAH